MQRIPATLAGSTGRVHWNQDYADVVMGLGLAGLVVLTLVWENRQPTPVAVVLLALQTLPICFRRRNPIRVLEITGGSIVLYSALGYTDANGSLGVLTAFYTVAANEPRRRAAWSAAITAVGISISLLAYSLFHGISSWTFSLALNFALFAIAWLVGDNLRVRRAYTRELEERAARLERDREDKAAAAVSEERTRIARELHDVVAHYVSVAVVQASGARRVLDRDPAAARAALEAVETAGRTALIEMRRMLEVLRTDDPGLGPQPGLGELERLVDSVRAAGLPVELAIEGGACCLPPGMDLAAYRIVQEALTNTVRHAGRAAARVTIRYAADQLEIEVVDDGRGAAAPLIEGGEGGHGLIGMKERVTLFGGELQVGPVFPGGWRVFARLPLEPGAGASASRQRDRDTADPGGDGGNSKATRRPRPRDKSLVAPNVKPPFIGRVVPPHPVPLPNRDSSRRERGGEL